MQTSNNIAKKKLGIKTRCIIVSQKDWKFRERYDIK